MRKFFALNFRTGLLIGCAIAVAVATVTVPRPATSFAVEATEAVVA